MSNFTKVMLSAASGNSSGAGDPYGSFRIQRTSPDGLDVNATNMYVDPVHIPTTDQMLLVDEFYELQGGSNVKTANVVSIDKTQTPQLTGETAVFKTQSYAYSSYTHTQIHQILVDPANNGDYYVVVGCGNAGSDGWSTVYVSSSSDRHAGSDVLKFNSSHQLQWQKTIYNNNSNGNYTVWLFFIDSQLWVQGGAYTNGYGIAFAKMDSSTGNVVTGGYNNFTDTIWRRSLLKFAQNTKFYNPANNRIYIGGYHYTGSANVIMMENLTPADGNGNFSYNYQKSIPYNHAGSNEEHGNVVDANYIWSCTTSGGPLAIRQRDLNWTWVSGTKIEFTDTWLSSTSNVYGSKLIQHPKDSNYLIGGCCMTTSQSGYRYLILFKFNKTTKTHTVIESLRISSSPPGITGLSATATAVTWTFRQNDRSVLYHLDIDDIDNDTFAHNTTNLYNVTNTTSTTTTGTSSESTPTLTSVLPPSKNSSNYMRSNAPTNNGVSTVSGVTRYTTKISL